ncbi:MAG: hypothetical protein ACI9WU_003178 [Myxococcota bacterium]
MADANPDPSNLKSRLRVVVRSETQVTQQTDRLSQRGQEPVARPIAGGLYALYVLTTDNDDYEPLTREALAGLALDEPRLHVASVRNIINEIQAIEREGDDGAWLLSEPGGLEESLMFVPAVWTWVSKWTVGDPVACLPSRDVLLVTGADDEQGLLRLREAADAVLAEGESAISTAILRWDGTRWRVLDAHGVT